MSISIGPILATIAVTLLLFDAKRLRDLRNAPGGAVRTPKQSAAFSENLGSDGKVGPVQDFPDR